MKDRDEHLKELQDEDRGKKPEKEVDKVTKAMEELTKAVVERYQASNTIKREGSQIVIPSFMNLIDVAQTLMDPRRPPRSPLRSSGCGSASAASPRGGRASAT